MVHIEEHRRRPAALDTSFWNAACHAESEGYALQLFTLHAPRVVVEEIESEQPPRTRPKAVLFLQLREAALIRVVDPVKVTVTVFSPGERAVLSLASERKWHALVNEWRAHDYGRDVLGLETVSVPELLVAVCYAGSLGKNEALRLLRKLAPITSAQLMLDATRLIGEVPT